MAKGTITVRLSEELIDQFRNEAETQGTTVSQLVINAIHKGREASIVAVTPPSDPDNAAQPIESRESSEEEIAGALKNAPVWVPGSKVEMMVEECMAMQSQLIGQQMALAELVFKAVRASSAAHYYARLSSAFALDISNFMTTQQPLDKETKLQRLEGFAAKVREFSDNFVAMPYEDVAQGKHLVA